MKVKLLNYTPNPERTVALATRVCHSSKSMEELHRQLSNGEVSPGELIEKVIARGHFSVLEHVNFTFGIEGVSRSCTHQLVRHRLASYSQQSQRYVKIKGKLRCVVPQKLARNKELRREFNQLANRAKNFYDRLIEREIPAEDARYILPEGTQTSIVVTMNARELRHFFRLRTAKGAQWEIRNLAKEMLKKVNKIAPHIFPLDKLTEVL